MTQQPSRPETAGRAAACRRRCLLDAHLARQHRLEAALAQTPFLVGDRLSLADVALVAYTRVAGEGGFDLTPHPQVRRWIAQVETGLRIG